jgi:hypothetical protein
VSADTCVAARGSGGVVGEGGADFVDVGAVGADGFMQGLAGDVELFRPVGDVGGDFGVDLFGIAGALGVLFVGGVGLVGFGGVVMLGHAGFLFPVGLVRWMRMRGGGMYWVGGSRKCVAGHGEWADGRIGLC